MVSESSPADSSDPPTSEILGRLRAHRGGAQRYRLAGEVARGGMGAILRVWDDDLRRPLAMKVVLGGEPGSSATPITAEADRRRLARFLEEAQITGQLEHPGIVPVHELGIDAEGRAYFTMRLVRGRDLESILKLLDGGQEGWTLARFVGVMLRVAEAMAFAHDRHVLHRDLKPANVMVGPFGEVYVMDWGLARVLGKPDRHDVRLRQPEHASSRIATDRRDQAQDSDPGLYTMDGDVVGTPAYMAPEQARGELEQLDGRADVYSLGAMLYRALAGCAPYCRGGDRPATHVLFELLKGPPEPLGPICPKAPPELIAIADKAMARSPADRYPTALAVADDLRAFLEQRVVAAFEAGAWAEARKWIRRNRPLAASLLAAVLLLAGGLVTSLVLKREADHQAGLASQQATRAEEQAQLAGAQRLLAVASSERAERDAAVARAINGFLNDDVLAAVAPENMGVDVTMREVLQQSALRLDSSFGERPEVESALRMTIGESFLRLGEPKQAMRQFERALELRDRDLGEHAEETLQARLRVASTRKELGDAAAAEAALLAVRADALATHGGDHRAVLIADNDLALLYSTTGRRAEARALYARTLENEERVLGADHDDTVTTRLNLGTLLTDMNDLAAAEPLLVEAHAARARNLGDTDPRTLEAANSVALLRLAQGRFAAGEAMLADQLAKRVEVLGEDHVSCGRALTSLGMARTRMGRYGEAEQDLRRAIGILGRRLGEEHQWTLLAASNLAACLHDAGRLPESLPLRERTLAGQKRVLGPEHPETLTSMSNLASLYHRLGRRPEAEQLGNETLQLAERVLGPDHPDTLIMRENLSGFLFARGEYARSEAMLQRVLEGRQRSLGEQHPAVARTLYNLAMIRRATGDDAAAEPLFEEVLRRNRRDLPADDPAIADVLARLASCRSKAKDYEAAARYYREAIEVRERTVDPDAPECTVLHQDLGVALLLAGDLENAQRELRLAYDRRLRVHGADHDYTVAAGYGLGTVLLRQQDYAEAEPLLLAFVKQREAQDRLGEADSQRCIQRLVDLYEATERPAAAAAWRAKLQ